MNLQCKNILVIDDDQAIRQTLQDVLEIHGFNVITANDGLDAINKLSSMKDIPCLILLDLMMPGMNGWGFLDYQRMHPSFASVPVVICSAYEGSARSMRTNPVIIKPIKLDVLLGTVQAFCA